MRKNISKLIIAIAIAATPLTYYLFREYLPVYSRRPLVYEILFFAPYIFYIIIAYLGIKLNQTRIFFSSLLWIEIYYFLNTAKLPFIDLQLNESLLPKYIAVFSILILFFIFSLKEEYIFSKYGLLQLLFLLIPFALLIPLMKFYQPGMYTVLIENPVIKYEFWYIPDIIWLVVLGLFSLFFLQKDKSIQHFKYTILICLLPLIIAMNFTAGRGQIDIEARIINAFSFLIIALLLLYALFKMYWEKVYIDELTGIANRRAFDEYLKKLGKKYTIVMIDIDHFKGFNDKYGHTEGDNILRFVARHIADESGGNVFRYGGEEFSIIYKGLLTKDVFWRLEQMRDNLSEKTFSIRTLEEIRNLKTKKDRKHTPINVKKVKVTFSAGVAHKTPEYKLPYDVIDAADKAMYKAKKSGRNKCVKAVNK